MPTVETIKDLGAYGVLLLCVVVAVWKGLPWLKSGLELFLTTIKEEAARDRDTFRNEIQKERDMGLSLLKEERARNDAATAELRKIVEHNSEVVDRNTDAMESLQRTVEKFMDAKVE